MSRDSNIHQINHSLGYPSRGISALRRRVGALRRRGAALLLALLLAAVSVPFAGSEQVYAANFQTVMIESVISRMLSTGTGTASSGDEEVQIVTGTTSVQKSAGSVYQKLAAGEDISILIIGDSIGTGSGTYVEEDEWFNVLTAYLEETYYGAKSGSSSDHIRLTNLSMGGNDSYAGYVTAIAFDDGTDYDLVILCYGQNDSERYFAEYYEALIRAVKTNYPSACLLSILESSQGSYTTKIQEQIELCDYYGIPTVDTIAAFANSGYAAEELTCDGIHPSSLGQMLYAQYAAAVIDANVAAGTTASSMPSVYNKAAKNYDSFLYYTAGGTDADSTVQFVRVNETTYTLTTQASGIIGIHYSYRVGDSVPDIYIDGEQVTKPVVYCAYDFTEGLIQVVGRGCVIKEEITLVFGTSEQADGFLGLCISW